MSVHLEANRTDASCQWQSSSNRATWKICTSMGSSTDPFSFLMKDTLNRKKYSCAVYGAGQSVTSNIATVTVPPTGGRRRLSVSLCRFLFFVPLLRINTWLLRRLNSEGFEPNRAGGRFGSNIKSQCQNSKMDILAFRQRNLMISIVGILTFCKVI